MDVNTLRSEPAPVFDRDGAFDHYEISVPSQLSVMRDWVNGGLSFDLTYRLINDIDLGGVEWIPIGTGTQPLGGAPARCFSGLFDGNGHAVRNMVLVSDDYRYSVAGLFGLVSADAGGGIRGLLLDSAVVKVGARLDKIYAGGIAGHNSSGTVSGCLVSGNIAISASRYRACAGGIAGLNGGSVINCAADGIFYVYSDFTATSNKYSGGIAGFNDFGSIMDCASSGSVITVGRGLLVAGGGIAAANSSLIKNSGSSCSVAAILEMSRVKNARACAGGAVGENMGDLDECFASGSVEAESETGLAEAGGLVGANSLNTDAKNTCSIKNCFSSGSALASASDGHASVGGLAGNNSGHIVSSYAYGGVAIRGGGRRIGGAAGYNKLKDSKTNLISKCYWLRSKSIGGVNWDVDRGIGESSSSGGRDVVWALDENGFRSAKNFINWDFDSVWSYTDLDGGARPSLRHLFGGEGGAFIIPDSAEMRGGMRREVRLMTPGYAVDGDGLTFDGLRRVEVGQVSISPAASSPDVFIISSDSWVTDASADISVGFAIGGREHTKRFRLDVSDGLEIGTEILPDGWAGAKYSAAVDVTGGIGEVALAVSVTPHPGDIVVGAGGFSFMTRGDAVSYDISVTAEDSARQRASREYSVLMEVPPPEIGELVSRYLVRNGAGVRIPVSGGSGGLTFGLSGDAPPGLSISSDGVISYSGEHLGEIEPEVSVRDEKGRIGSRVMRLVVVRAVELCGGILPDGTAGEDYRGVCAAEGGAEPYVFEALRALPDGMELGPDGVLRWTPAAVGDYPLKISVKDASGQVAEGDFRLSVYDPVKIITPHNLPAGVAGGSYFARVEAIGGRGRVAFAPPPGEERLPPGLAIDGTGVVSGVPEALGLFSFSVEASDVYGRLDRRKFALLIEAAPQFPGEPGEPGGPYIPVTPGDPDEPEPPDDMSPISEIIETLNGSLRGVRAGIAMGVSGCVENVREPDAIFIPRDAPAAAIDGCINLRDSFEMIISLDKNSTADSLGLTLFIDIAGIDGFERWRSIEPFNRTDMLSGMGVKLIYEFVDCQPGGEGFLTLVGDGGALSWHEAVDAGVVSLSEYGITLNYVVRDAAGELSVVGSALVIPDGRRDFRLEDPVWLICPEVPSKRPDERSAGSGGCGASSAAWAVGSVAAAALLAARRRGQN